ncbi:hypothetical protein EBU91_00770 [bacterium]|nr:hypothetical protein [bacterium]
MINSLKKDKVVFSIHSDYNGNLKVVDRGYGRELVSDKGVYLSISENHKFLDKGFFGILAKEISKKRNNLKKALIIGLAGGTIPNILFKKYPGIEIISVEIDPLMNDIYKYFFSGDKHDRHRIINVDANYLLKNPERFNIFEEQFDFILLDTFSSISPKEFDSYRNFFKCVKKLLKKNGIMGVNMISQNDELYEKAQENVRFISETFNDTDVNIICNIFGNANVVVLASDKLNL